MRRVPRSVPVVAILLSLLLHGALLAPLVGMMMDEAPVLAAPAEGEVEPGTVELLPVEVAGADPTDPDTAVADAAPMAEPTEPQDQAEAQEPAERVDTAEAEPTQPPPPEQPAQPQPQERASGLTLHFAGTDSASSAIASGANLIPASPDDRSRNRPPVYPPEAQRYGQQGTVVLMIRVSPMGLAEGAEVVASSGYRSLDQAAVDAVLTWRFRPAIQDGRAIRFEMPMRIVFAMK